MTAGPFTVPDRNRQLIIRVESLRPATRAGQAKGQPLMGRHSKPRVTFRNVAVVTAASAGLAMALTGTAGADPILGNCTIDGPGSNGNPEVTVCQDHGYRHGLKTDQGNRVHALVKVDPLACVHVVIDPEGNRRLVGTLSCDRWGGPVPVSPAGPVVSCVPCPTNPCVTPTTPGGSETSGSQGTEGSTTGTPVSSGSSAGEAPVPQTVEAHLPVTH